MKEIKTYGESVLREIAVKIENIDEDIVKLIDEMKISMEESNGIGLAAPQIGESISLFVTQAPEDEFRVFINPEIIFTSLETCVYEEGCLSVPGFYENVKRAERIIIQAQNQRGRLFKLEADGMLARVILHEYDHLQGKLFIDYLPQKKFDKIVNKIKSKK